MPEDVQSRFTVYERPTASPGKCIVCGAVDRPVVDFGVDVDLAPPLGFGCVYFCVTCIKQAASKFPDEIDHERDMVNAEYMAKRLAEQKENLYDGLRDYLNRFDSRPVYGTPDSVVEQTEPDDTQDIERDESKPSESDREADEPLKLEGPPRVPSTSSGGLFDGLFDSRV